MRKHTFSTRRAAGMTPVEVTVMVPSYDEATDKQRRAVYDDGLFGQGTVVPVQTRMRNQKPEVWADIRLLTAATQGFFNDRINSVRTATQVMDARGANLTPEQVKLFESQGFTVITE